MHAKPISNKELIDWFLHACDELAGHPFRRRSQMPRIRAVEGTSGVRFLTEHPNESHLGDFVRQLRILLSPREPIYVESVHVLLQEIVIDADLNAMLVSICTEWKRSDRQCLTIVDSGHVVRAYDAWRLILNSRYMHFDVEKRRRTQTLEDHNLLWMYELKFYDFIERASAYVLGIGSIARQALEQDQVDWSRAPAAPRDAA